MVPYRGHDRRFLDQTTTRRKFPPDARPGHGSGCTEFTPKVEDEEEERRRKRDQAQGKAQVTGRPSPDTLWNRPQECVGAPDTMVLWSSIQVNGTVVGAVGPYMDYTQYCSISNNKQ